QALQAVPGPLHPAHGVDPRLVVPQQLLPQRAARAQAVSPADVVEPEQDSVGHRVTAREAVAHRKRVLAHRVAAAGRAVEAEAGQSRSLPTLATPAMPRISFPTVEPGPRAYVSARRISSHSGARNARWLSWPRYSLVIWTSIIRVVRGIVPNSGWNGSRGWKSSGPFFT